MAAGRSRRSRFPSIRRTTSVPRSGWMTDAIDTPKVVRVLIVDDEPLARQRIEDLLAHEDHVSIAGTAATGTDAVTAIRNIKPDLVFLDVQMPGMTGLQVVD